jgi:hypothetical protein
MGEFDEPLNENGPAIADTAAAHVFGSKIGEVNEPLTIENQVMAKTHESDERRIIHMEDVALIGSSANKDMEDIDEPATEESTTASETDSEYSPLSPETSVSLDDWLRFGPHCYDSKFDPFLAARLVAVLQRQGISEKFFASDQDSGPDEETHKAMWLLLRSFRLLHLCHYSTSDIECIVGHASLYLEDLVQKLRQDGESEMEIKELARVFCLFMFIAHSYIMDHCCKLAMWHAHLFSQYCRLNTLNDAVLRLMELRDFVLRVEPTRLEARLDWLRDGDVN